MFQAQTLHEDPHEESKISRGELSHEIKIAMDFNAANSVRCENKVLELKTHYMVSNVTDYK